MTVYSQPVLAREMVTSERHDVEKQVPVSDSHPVGRTSESSASRLLLEVLAKGRVEGHGIVPLPVEDRTSTRYFNVFTIWASMNTNILA